MVTITIDFNPYRPIDGDTEQRILEVICDELAFYGICTGVEISQ